MLARTYTATTIGLEPIKIEVEVDSTRGTPNLILIGLATKAVEESKERITSALINCGIRIRSRRTIVNLAPADIPKRSPTFELAIAIGMLKMYGEVTCDTDNTLFFGELSLDGELKPVRGALPLVLAARSMGFKRVVLPAANVNQVHTIRDLQIHPINHLRQYLAFAQQQAPLPVCTPKAFAAVPATTTDISFQHIAGQATAKRALTIAATGGHNVLMIGPPGVGKSTLAKSLVSILPPLTETEALEVTAIYSVHGHTNQLITARPFRAPHHTVSYAGLIGGGSTLRPGEISLAHRGILFLDELTEYSHSVLESLRQPLEDRRVTLARASGSVVYPAAFTLIAAANPCPCGWYGSSRTCQCSLQLLHQHQRKLSGPLLDRIDLCIYVTQEQLAVLHVPTATNLDQTNQIRAQVQLARQAQAKWLTPRQKLLINELTAEEIKQLVTLSSESRQLLTRAAARLKLTTRSYLKTIKVALTIAHLENTTTINPTHVAEALSYRHHDREE